MRPVGGDTEVPFDVRLIAATNIDLESAVEEGRFREDLFFRIDVIPVEVPPLRTRGGDILLLAQRFAEDPSELVPLELIEKRYILRVLDALGGNKTLAARVLGLDRKTLYRKLERYVTDEGRAPSSP